MTPHVVKIGDISLEHFQLFQEMRRIFERLPDFSFANPVSCHVICRAFAENYPVECVDGYFGAGDHSWLVLDRYTSEEHGKDGLVIADMYPCAGASPFLVFTFSMLPWAELYREDPSVVASRVDDSDFRMQLTTVATAIASFRQNFIGN